MIQIKIIKSSKPTYWYHNHIGDILNVYDNGNEQWYIPINKELVDFRKDDEGLLFIRKDDTEIFDRKKKIERIKNNLYK